MKHVAHVCSFEKNGRPMIAWDKAKDIKLGDKLYVAPKREWVGLTAYEIQEIHLGNQHWGSFACAIEQALKEKNHG